MTVMFRPLSGLLQVRKSLPLQCLPLTIELSLVDDPLEPIIFGGAAGGGLPANSFTNANVSNQWSILKCSSEV